MARLLVLFLLVLVAGCSSSSGTGPGGGGASSARVTGIVRSGGSVGGVPLARARVRLFAANAGAPVVLGEAVTNDSGRFLIDAPQAGGALYATATLEDGAVLLAVLGNSPPSFVTLNELTTVAGAYSTARLYQDGGIRGSEMALLYATAMNTNLADLATGDPGPVMLTSPNADQTNGLRSLRSLSNLLAECLRDPGSRQAFLALTTPPGGAPPANTWEALVNLAHRPGQGVLPLYDLSRQAAPFTPALALPPDAWTLAVKVNDSGDDAYPIGGTANVVFHEDGLVWVCNNTVQGTIGSTIAGVLVLNPDGSPSDGRNGTPTSPLKTGGLLGPGFGICADPSGDVWVGNFGWGGVNPTADGNGSVSQFRPDGTAVSPADAWQGGPVRAQATVSDAQGNIWITSFETDEIWVFPGGDPESSFSFPTADGPFGLAIAADGTAWATTSTSVPGRTYHLRINGNSLEEISRTEVGLETKGLAVDSLGNVWVPSAVTDSIFLLSPQGQVLGEFSGGSIDGPWSVSIDGDDNVWVSNFGDTLPGSVYDRARITLLAGANPATHPPGVQTGDVLSPDLGFTLHTAGEQVLLQDGSPLYGPGAPPAYTPMMRLTSVNIDPAGNLWAANNWKPDFTIDFNSNPGGDGMVIFVGLAEPLR